MNEVGFRLRRLDEVASCLCVDPWRCPEAGRDLLLREDKGTGNVDPQRE